VLNYDAPDERWPASVKASFEEYVKNGGGLVIVHAADNALMKGASIEPMTSSRRRFCIQTQTT